MKILNIKLKIQKKTKKKWKGVQICIQSDKTELNSFLKFSFCYTICLIDFLNVYLWRGLSCSYNISLTIILCISSFNYCKIQYISLYQTTFLSHLLYEILCIILSWFDGWVGKGVTACKTAVGIMVPLEF